MHLISGTDVSPTSEERPLHLRLDPQPFLGRGTEAPALPCASREGTGDPGCDMHLIPGTDVSPASEEPLQVEAHSKASLQTGGATSPVFEAAGQVLMEKINSPQGGCFAVHEAGGSAGASLPVPSRPVNNGHLRILGPDPPRCLVGPLETSGPAPVSPHEPVGPLETCISMPISPQLRSGPLKTNALRMVSPQLVSGFPETTFPVSGSPETTIRSSGLPLQLSGMAGRVAITVLHNEATKALKVYFRRRTKANLLQISQNGGIEEGLIQTNNTLHSASRIMNQPTSKKEGFLRKISKAAEEILLAPKQVLNTSSSPHSSRVAAPRRSRRIAGAGVEFNMQDWGNRSTKKAMRALHIISEAEGTAQEALDTYARVFKHSLSQNQVEALAALFGWTPPPGLVY
jgi:hypothetical protein